MTKPLCLDARNKPLSVGDFVCYTTNSRGAGLSFGHILKISEKPVERYRYDRNTGTRTTYPDLDFKIQVLITDAFGQPQYETEFDREKRQYVETPVQSKSGHVEHSKHKFLLMS